MPSSARGVRSQRPGPGAFVGKVLVGVLALLAAVVAVPQPATAGAGGSTLVAGETLTAGQQLRSADGSTSLVMQGDGNVVVYGPAGPTWASGTGVAGSRLVMQGDGNLVAYTPANGPVWNSRTSGARSVLVVQDDGNVVVYDGRGVATWASNSDPGRIRSTLTAGEGLAAGQRLTSADRSHQLVMQGDGNLVVYGSRGPTWASRTGVPGSRVVMQGDGNLVVYTPYGAPVWHTHTGGNPGARTVLQDDGNLVLYRQDGLPPWSLGSPLAGLDVGGSSQFVRVSVPSATATSGTLTAWTLTPGGWSAAVGPVTARVGSAGVGATREGMSRTPQGTFTLTEAFGRMASPGTALPYRVIDGNDWWVSDTTSSLYNQYARCVPGQCPFDEAAGENLYQQGSVYDYAAVIDYNRAGVRGAGSAFFLHVSNGSATAGCVAIPRDSLVAVLRWLAPSRQPVISIGVG